MSKIRIIRSLANRIFQPWVGVLVRDRFDNPAEGTPSVKWKQWTGKGADVLATPAELSATAGAEEG